MDRFADILCALGFGRTFMGMQLYQASELQGRPIVGDSLNMLDLNSKSGLANRPPTPRRQVPREKILLRFLR